MPKTLLRSGSPAVRRAATTPREWRDLCQKAVARAQKAGDRRFEGLQKALENHREQVTLQALGIICESDLDREFSVPPT
jgi:hypothetical protein